MVLCSACTLKQSLREPLGPCASCFPQTYAKPLYSVVDCKRSNEVTCLAWAPGFEKQTVRKMKENHDNRGNNRATTHMVRVPCTSCEENRDDDDSDARSRWTTGQDNGCEECTDAYGRPLEMYDYNHDSCNDIAKEAIELDHRETLVTAHGNNMVHFWSIGDDCCCLSKWNTPKTFMCPSSQLSPETGFISFGNIESEIACLGFSKTNPDEAYRHLGLSQGRGSFDMAVPLERYRYQEHEPWPFTIKHDLDGRTAPAKYLHVVPQELGEVGTRTSVVYSADGTMVARATSGLGPGTCTVVKMSGCLAGFRGFQEPGEEEDDNVANPNGTGKVLLEFELSDSVESSSLAFSPDGKAFAWGRDASVKVWSMSDEMWDWDSSDDSSDIMYEWMEEYGGEEGEVGLPGGHWHVTCIALSAARQSCTGKPLLAVANRIRFFILEGEQEDGFFHQPPKVVRQIARGMAIAFSPRANVLAVSADDNVRLYDTYTGDLLRVLAGDRSSIECMSWNSSGRFLAAGCKGRSLEAASAKVWNLWELNSVIVARRIAVLLVVKRLREEAELARKVERALSLVEGAGADELKETINMLSDKLAASIICPKKDEPNRMAMDERLAALPDDCLRVVVSFVGWQEELGKCPGRKRIRAKEQWGRSEPGDYGLTHERPKGAGRVGRLEAMNCEEANTIRQAELAKKAADKERKRTAKARAKAEARKRSRSWVAPEVATEDRRTCNGCGVVFDSRSAMFRHIEESVECGDK